MTITLSTVCRARRRTAMPVARAYLFERLDSEPAWTI